MDLRVKENYDVGVIVGRFQVPELHDAHMALVRSVQERHSKILVFLGLSPLMVTRENPLDFESRKQMILAEFPDVSVLYIKDVNNDQVWSKRLDEQIQDLISPSQTVVLYGGRDSFVNHYFGKFSTRELQQDVWISGTEIRKSISQKSTKADPAFRAGVVWAAYSRFPTCYPTVDVAILNDDGTKLLLGRKQFEDKYRFIGGFADPKSDSYEADAIREVKEETGLDIDDPQYIGSFIVDDWRYRGEVDKIKTLLFIVNATGNPKPDDDIYELRWFDLNTLDVSDVVSTHEPLLVAVQNFLR